MRAIDPIFVTPRVVQRDWGRDDLGCWQTVAPKASGPVGEVWLQDAANTTDKGPLGRRISTASQAVLGDLGRAPPRVRLVFPSSDIKIASTTPVSFWTLLEAGNISVANASMGRPGERIRAYEGAPLTLPSGSVALEVSSPFQPNNAMAENPSTVRLPPVSRRARATLMREDALSVEMWTLPEVSRLTPDGETCHVLVALTSDIVFDDRVLHMGETVFLPAWGRASTVHSRRPGARMLVAYPDRTPTVIWRHTPGPDPTPGLLPRPHPQQPAAWRSERVAQSALAA